MRSAPLATAGLYYSPFMYCSGCGGFVDGGAVFCSVCGRRQPLAHAFPLPLQQIPQSTAGYFPAQMERGYRWGQVHGWLLIFAALFLLRPHPSPNLIFSTVFIVVLGICVLRRNRLILPLMAAWLLTQLFWVLAHPVILAGERLVLPLLLWCVYFAYYYRRRDEFVTWV
jgi:hypothetical protein